MVKRTDRLSDGDQSGDQEEDWEEEFAVYDALFLAYGGKPLKGPRERGSEDMGSVARLRYGAGACKTVQLLSIIGTWHRPGSLIPSEYRANDSQRVSELLRVFPSHIIMMVFIYHIYHYHFLIVALVLLYNCLHFCVGSHAGQEKKTQIAIYNDVWCLNFTAKFGKAGETAMVYKNPFHTSQGSWTIGIQMLVRSGWLCEVHGHGQRVYIHGTVTSASLLVVCILL